MENVNCLRCRFRHKDNGNCTAVGGFCTAVPAAHCPLLREYLGGGRLMVKYITKEAALNTIFSEPPEAHYPSWYAERIKALPAADVAPVTHGWWNADETCSLCGEKSTEGLDATKWNYWLPNYCPNCGAKMGRKDDC